MVYIGWFDKCIMSLLNEAYRMRYTGESAGATKKCKALEHLDDAITRAEQAYQAKRAKAEAAFRANGLWSYRALMNTSMSTLAQQYADETVGKQAVVTLTTALLTSIRDACL